MNVAEISDEDFDLDVLMRRIRADVEKRRAAAIEPTPGMVRASSAHDASRSVGSSDRLRLRRLDHAGVPFESKDRYKAGDFLRYHDEEFVRNVYRGVLRRGPDGTGLSSFLDQLRSGHTSRIEVLARVRYSREGRAMGVPINGLLPRFVLRSLQHMPVIGRLAGIVQNVIRLPELAANYERFEMACFQCDLEMRRQIDTNSSLVEQSVNTLAQQSSDKSEKAQHDQTRLEAELTAIERTVREVQAFVGQLRFDMSTKANVDALTFVAESLSAKADSTEMRTFAASLDRKADAEDLAALSRRLSALAAEAAVRPDLIVMEERLSAALDEMSGHLAARARFQIPLPGVEPRFDSFYRQFEDAFRGTRGDIASRVEIYVPVVAEANAGTKGYPILDIGCGRGEWLDVVKKHGLTGRGVDANPVMVAECVGRGLQVVAADAQSYLRSLESSSMGAVTAMHIVEHLPFGELLAVVEEALRVLCPGGVLIMETPNPENLSVGSNTFYLDPTHRRPIPPPLLEFVVRRLGFVDIAILRLHPRPEEDWLTAGQGVDRGRLNQLLFGPQDYAIIARTPGHVSSGPSTPGSQ